jgi:hypothetical protein
VAHQIDPKTVRITYADADLIPVGVLAADIHWQPTRVDLGVPGSLVGDELSINKGVCMPAPSILKRFFGAHVRCVSLVFLISLLDRLMWADSLRSVGASWMS